MWNLWEELICPLGMSSESSSDDVYQQNGQILKFKLYHYDRYSYMLLITDAMYIALCLCVL